MGLLHHPFWLQLVLALSGQHSRSPLLYSSNVFVFPIDKKFRVTYMKIYPYKLEIEETTESKRFASLSRLCVPSVMNSEQQHFVLICLLRIYGYQLIGKPNHVKKNTTVLRHLLKIMLHELHCSIFWFLYHRLLWPYKHIHVYVAISKYKYEDSFRQLML